MHASVRLLSLCFSLTIFAADNNADIKPWVNSKLTALAPEIQYLISSYTLGDEIKRDIFDNVLVRTLHNDAISSTAIIDNTVQIISGDDKTVQLRYMPLCYNDYVRHIDLTQALWITHEYEAITQYDTNLQKNGAFTEKEKVDQIQCKLAVEKSIDPRIVARLYAFKAMYDSAPIGFASTLPHHNFAVKYRQIEENLYAQAFISQVNCGFTPAELKNKANELLRLSNKLNDFNVNDIKEKFEKKVSAPRSTGDYENSLFSILFIFDSAKRIVNYFSLNSSARNPYHNPSSFDCDLTHASSEKNGIWYKMTPSADMSFPFHGKIVSKKNLNTIAEDILKDSSFPNMWSTIVVFRCPEDAQEETCANDYSFRTCRIS